MSSINQTGLHVAGKGRPTASPLVKSLAGLAALAVAMGIGRFAFTPILPMMLHDAGLTVAAGKWLASANYFGYLLGALAAMFLRVRVEATIRVGLLVIGLTTLAMGLPFAITGWLALRLVAGVASACVLISLSAWSMETLAPYQRPFLVGLVFSGVGTGIAGAGLVCIALTDGHAGSEFAWETLGILSLGATALLWRQFSAPSTPPIETPQSMIVPFQWNAPALRLVLCYGISGFGYIIPATFLPVMARSALSVSSAFAWSWPLFGLAAAASTLAVTRLPQRHSKRRLWIWGHWMMAVGIVLPIASPQLLAILAAAVCVGSTFMIVTLAAMQEAKQVAPEHARVLMAAMTAAFAIGQIVGPLCVRTTIDGQVDFSSGLILAACLLASSTLLLERFSKTAE